MCRPQDYQQRGRRKQRTTSVEAALHEHSCNLPTIGLSGEAASWGWECCQVRFHVSGKIFDACNLDTGGLDPDASNGFGQSPAGTRRRAAPRLPIHRLPPLKAPAQNSPSGRWITLIGLLRRQYNSELCEPVVHRRGGEPAVGVDRAMSGRALPIRGTSRWACAALR